MSTNKPTMSARAAAIDAATAYALGVDGRIVVRYMIDAILDGITSAGYAIVESPFTDGQRVALGLDLTGVVKETQPCYLVAWDSGGESIVRAEGGVRALPEAVNHE